MHRGHRHRRPRQRLSRRHRAALYACSLALFVSGCGWLISHYLLRGADLGDTPHPSEPWWMRLHGAAMLGFLVAFGALLPRHVAQGWRERVNRASGVSMVILVAVLALSGYGLYYLVDDTLRAWVGVLHWSVGLAAAALLGLHVVRGLRWRRSSAADHDPPW